MSALVERPMRDAVIASVHQRMKVDSDIVFLSADMGAPALDALREEFRDRFLNVGIAEQNLINVASGLSLEGCTVFTYAIAPFYLRAIEQIRVNVSFPAQLRPMNVNMLALGAGYSYDVSGPTHHCVEDISIFRAIPNISTISPADTSTALSAAAFSGASARPKYLRLDGKSHTNLVSSIPDIADGFREIATGDSVCVVATGVMTHTAMELARKFPGRVGVADVFRLDDDIDEKGLVEIMKKARLGALTLEEGYISRGGLDTMIASILRKHVAGFRLEHFGIKSVVDFLPGSRHALHRRSGVSIEQMESVIGRWLSS